LAVAAAIAVALASRLFTREIAVDR
jgi:hypothetical protein